MDKCFICKKPIEEGIQYIVSRRKIHYRDKSWLASNHGHFAFCDECNEKVTKTIERFQKGESMGYVYGMMERGFSPGCQPMHDFIRRMDDEMGYYYDLLVYSTLLSADEMHQYELEFVGEVDE